MSTIQVLGSFGKTNYYPDIFFINRLIKKLGEPNKRKGRNPLFSSSSNNERLNTCIYLFNYAIHCGIADAVSYNSLIDAAGKNHNLELASWAFREAKEKGLANIVSYNSLINAASRNNDLALASSTFNEAKGKGLDNIVSYNSLRCWR